MKTSILLPLASLFLMTNAMALNDAEFVQKMKKEFLPLMASLKSPKLVFHWADASDITPQGQYNSTYPANAPHFANYVDKQGKKIFAKRDPRDRDIAGPGLYMATDPLASRDYGGQKSFGLIVGVISPRAQLIYQNSTVNISQSLLQEFNRRGCKNVFDIDDLLATNDGSCTKIKQLLFGRDISFAEGSMYSWSTRPMIGCRNRDNISKTRDLIMKIRPNFINDTFVAYSPKMFSEILGVTHKTIDGGSSLGKQVLSYLKGIQELKKSNQLHYSYDLLSKEQMANPKIQAMTKAEVENFNKKYVFGCN